MRNGLLLPGYAEMIGSELAQHITTAVFCVLSQDYHQLIIIVLTALLLDYSASTAVPGNAAAEASLVLQP